MKIMSFIKKNWIHFVTIFLFLVVCLIYFSPQLDGYGLKQQDIEQWKGSSHETEVHRALYGEEPLWTNALFGGMPLIQISVIYGGNLIKSISNLYFSVIPAPMGIVFLHLICFYILGLFLRINPIVTALGAFAFAFASYEIIIIEAGHATKAMATAFLPAIVGSFIYCYQKRTILGILLSSLFMAFELSTNHVQVTYYLAFLLVFMGFVFLYDAWKNKELKAFSITTASLICGYLVALVINYGNIGLTTDYAQHTIRGGNDITINSDGTKATQQSSGLDKDYITQWSYGIGETFTLISPNVKGGGSYPLGSSPFISILENTEFENGDPETVYKYGSYWGNQPFTSGPVYIGAIIIFLAFLGLIFIKSRIKWALLAATMLAIVLSWGKNYMGLTDFFIDYIPGYNKFRTVTINLIVAELCLPILAVLFVNELIKNKDEIKNKIKPLYISSGVFFILLLLIKFIGLGDGYTSSEEKKQMANIDQEIPKVEQNIKQQILSINPQQLKEQYNININNQEEVDAFAKEQANNQIKSYKENFGALKMVRKNIFNSSMNRTILFVFIAGSFVFLFIQFGFTPLILSCGLLALVMADNLPVSNYYLGSEEIEESDGEYKHWVSSATAKYPITSRTPDEQILQNELKENPKLKAFIEKAKKKGVSKSEQLELEDAASMNLIDSYRFAELNKKTNYRVFDIGGSFQSNKASYFHKSLGGYHGAKLRNIQNLFDFHLSKSNNKVFDMMNVKYFIQRTQSGDTANINPTAMGNVWLVKTIETHKTPNQEIRALGNEFKLLNKGPGTLLINKKATKDATVYGDEKLQYLAKGKDTIDIPLSNGMRQKTEALFVMDVNGKTNLIPVQTQMNDTTNSFTTLVSISVSNSFDPNNEAIMLQSEANKIKKRKFSGEGEVKLTKYKPNHLTYEANVKGNQFAVFSEIYYSDGWKAFVDGKEVDIFKTNYLLRGIELSGGKHKVEFKFDLPKFHLLNKVSFTASILLLLGIGFFSFRRFKSK